MIVKLEAICRKYGIFSANLPEVEQNIILIIFYLVYLGSDLNSKETSALEQKYKKLST